MYSFLSFWQNLTCCLHLHLTALYNPRVTLNTQWYTSISKGSEASLGNFKCLSVCLHSKTSVVLAPHFTAHPSGALRSGSHPKHPPFGCSVHGTAITFLPSPCLFLQNHFDTRVNSEFGFFGHLTHTIGLSILL